MSLQVRQRSRFLRKGIYVCMYESTSLEKGRVRGDKEDFKHH